MSASREEKIQPGIYARTNALTGENFGQAQGHAKITSEFKKDSETGNVASIYIVVRESQYFGMITADYGYRMADGQFETDSVRFALLDTFQLAPDPHPSLITWREVPGEEVDAAQARLAKVGGLIDASLVTADVTSVHAQSLFPAILKTLREYDILVGNEAQIRVLKPDANAGELLHGHSARRYGNAYDSSRAADEKVRPKPVQSVQPSVSLAAAPTLFAGSGVISAPAVAPTAPAEIDAVAEGLTCPINLNVMRNPMLASDGHSYEESSIREWMDRSHGRVTRSPIDRTEIRDIFPNIELRNRIHERVLASPQLAEEFWFAHKEAILEPRHELDEVDFSAKFKKKYPNLVTEVVHEGPAPGMSR